MLDLNLLWPFILTSLLVNITPGPDILFIISRSMQAGLKAGLAGVIGIAIGAFLHSLLAALGLSLLFASSSTAFTIAKIIGALYLCYLGIKSLRQAMPTHFSPSKNRNPARSLLDGFLCNITNPKVALFMLAFLPQFVDTSKGNAGWQIILLGVIFNIGGTIANTAIAVFASKAARLLKGRFQRYLDRLCGCLFIGLAIKLILAKR